MQSDTQFPEADAFLSAPPPVQEDNQPDGLELRTPPTVFRPAPVRLAPEQRPKLATSTRALAKGPPRDPRPQPPPPAATALDAGIAAGDVQNAMLDDAGRGAQAAAGVAMPVAPQPPMQATDRRDVGTRADMTWTKMATIEKVLPYNLGKIAGKDVQTLITKENRPFFDCGASVRRGCLRGGGATLVPAMDVVRIKGASYAQAKKDAQPDALVAAGICTYYEIVMAPTDPEVSAAPEICMGLKFVLSCETLRFGEFCTTISILRV